MNNARKFMWNETGTIETLEGEDKNYLYFESGDKVKKSLVGVTIAEIEEDSSSNDDSNDFFLNEEQKRSNVVNGMPQGVNSKPISPPTLKTEQNDSYKTNKNSNVPQNLSENDSPQVGDNLIEFEHEKQLVQNDKQERVNENDPIIQLIEKSKKTNRNLKLDIKLEVPSNEIIKIIKDNFSEDVFDKIAEYNIKDKSKDEIIDLYKNLISKSLSSTIRKRNTKGTTKKYQK